MREGTKNQALSILKEELAWTINTNIGKAG